MNQPAHGYFIKDNLVIPEHEVWFEFSHASGPGGQNVNKVASVATLCFAPAASGVLSAVEKKLAEVRLANRIGSDGVLRITSRESRSQAGNRALAAARFCQVLAEALKIRKKRKATQPSRASRERRLTEKRIHSLRKADRKPGWRDEECRSEGKASVKKEHPGLIDLRLEAFAWRPWRFAGGASVPPHDGEGRRRGGALR